MFAATHTDDSPVMIAGKGLTVKEEIVLQPVAKEYVIFTTPGTTPVTIPVNEPTVATAILLLVQVPPPVLLVSVVVLPSHTLNVPVMGTGDGLTKIVVVAIHRLLKE
jgi:hypothetical protein